MPELVELNPDDLAVFRALPALASAHLCTTLSWWCLYTSGVDHKPLGPKFLLHTQALHAAPPQIFHEARSGFNFWFIPIEIPSGSFLRGCPSHMVS